MIQLILRKPFYYTMRTVLSLTMKTPVFPFLMSPSAGRKFFFSIRLIPLVIALPITIILFFIAYLIDLKDKSPYVFMKGDASEKNDGAKSILSWDTCLLYGGLPIPLCGAASAYQRKDVISEKLNSLQNDIILLQNVSEDSAFWLFKNLKKNYSHFYFNFLKDPLFALNSGFFIASKIKFDELKVFPLPTNGAIKRGFILAKTKEFHLVLTQLDDGVEENDKQMRKNQVQIILEKIDLELKSNTLFLAGNLHMESKELEESGLIKHFYNQYDITVSGETATNYFLSLVRDVKPVEYSSDYILQNKKNGLKVTRNQGFQMPITMRDSAWINSNHHPLILELDKKEKP
jgi:hypothetical protein